MNSLYRENLCGNNFIQRVKNRCSPASIALFATLMVELIVLGCAEKSEDKIDSNIKATLESYYKVMSDRNWKLYKNFFYDSATITTIWQKSGDSVAKVHVISIEEFIREAPNGPDSKPIFSERMISFSGKQQGNIATVWTTYHARFGDENDLAEWDGTDVFTLMKHEDKWKIVSLVFQVE